MNVFLFRKPDSSAVEKERKSQLDWIAKSSSWRREFRLDDISAIFIPLSYRREDGEEGNAKRSNIYFLMRWLASRLHARPRNRILSCVKTIRGFPSALYSYFRDAPPLRAALRVFLLSSFSPSFSLFVSFYPPHRTELHENAKQLYHEM